MFDECRDQKACPIFTQSFGFQRAFLFKKKLDSFFVSQYSVSCDFVPQTEVCQYCHVFNVKARPDPLTKLESQTKYSEPGQL